MNAETKAAQPAKQCTKCKGLFGIDYFYSNKRRTGGLSSWCKGCEKEQRAEHHARNRERILGQKAARRAIADDAVKASRNEAARAAHRANPELYRERWRLYAQKRRARNPVVKLSDRISRRLRFCLATGKGGKSSAELLGYTMAELRIHLERQFLSGMSWENMDKWHIDHIVPLSSFPIETTDDPGFRLAWALPNLRPLWARDNMRKSAKRETLL